MQQIIFVVIGLLAGSLSGILGIGGAIFIIPVLVYGFGWSQHLAQGTTLAMLVPPIGLMAALQYYREGFVDLKVALLLCAGFFVGGFIGGKVAVELSSDLLRRLFGGFLFILSIRMMVWK